MIQRNEAANGNADVGDSIHQQVIGTRDRREWGQEVEVEAQCNSTNSVTVGKGIANE